MRRDRHHYTSCAPSGPGGTILPPRSLPLGRHSVGVPLLVVPKGTLAALKDRRTPLHLADLDEATPALDADDTTHEEDTLTGAEIWPRFGGPTEAHA